MKEMRGRESGRRTWNAKKATANAMQHLSFWSGLGILQFLLVSFFSESRLFGVLKFADGSQVPACMVLLLAALAAFLAAGILCLPRPRREFRLGAMRSGAVLFAAGSLVTVLGALGCSQLATPYAVALMAIGALALALGMLLATVQVCATLGRLGPRTAFLYGGLGTLVNLLLITLFHNCSLIGQAAAFVVLACALPSLLQHSALSAPLHRLIYPPETPSYRIPWRLTITSFFQGLSYGFMYLSFPVAQAGMLTFGLDMLGFLIAALCLLFAVGLFNVNYNRLIYQFSFSLIALSYLLLGLLGPLFAAALVVKNIGYTVLDISIIALSAYLVRERKASALTVALWPSLAMFFGHAITTALSAALPPSAFANAYFVVAFVLLFGALMLSNSNNLKTGWGLARSGDGTAEPTDFTLACSKIATEWNLTKRESEILALLAKGKNKTAIAERLTISVDTAKTHIANIYRKADVHSQQDLMDFVESVSEDLG